MKKAQIYPVTTSVAPGYVWKWSACTGNHTSPQVFEFYYDCLSDARSKGYEVDLLQPHGDTSPAGAEYKLRNDRAGERL